MALISTQVIAMPSKPRMTCDGSGEKDSGKQNPRGEITRQTASIPSGGSNGSSWRPHAIVGSKSAGISICSTNTAVQTVPQKRHDGMKIHQNEEFLLRSC
mmetsp:Transcript_62425/g.131941  ORF Transcript_62425/g.131941 Transcript_62425/m.131941 type:complete len:100 (-) Transcript_62425:499-798(-)